MLRSFLLFFFLWATYSLSKLFKPIMIFCFLLRCDRPVQRIAYLTERKRINCSENISQMPTWSGLVFVLSPTPPFTQTPINPYCLHVTWCELQSCNWESSQNQDTDLITLDLMKSQKTLDLTWTFIGLERFLTNRNMLHMKSTGHAMMKP